MAELTMRDLHEITDRGAAELIAELEQSDAPPIVLGRMHAKVGLHYMLIAEDRDDVVEFYRGIIDYLTSRKDH